MKPITEQSLYEILEIPRDAAADEIEKAYQRAKALYGPGSLATYSLVAPEEMALLNRRIEEAHRVLLDTGSRAGYDASLLGAAGDGPRPAPTRVPEPSATPAGDGPAQAAPAPGPADAAPPVAVAAATSGQSGTAAPGPAPPPAPVAASADPARPQAAPVASAAPAKPAFAAPEGAPWTGELIRQAREGRGLTLHQVAERTKVARHHLENIEADRHELLPAPVYLRGILISVAKELRLDPQKVSRSYLDSVQAAQAQKAPPKPR